MVCLAKLFPDHGIHLAEMVFGLQRRLLGSKAAPKTHAPVSPGSCNAATITLLSDGRRTTRADTLEAAQIAADRGVRVHVIGLGMPNSHLVMGEGMAYYLQLGEPTLRPVAHMTGGDDHQATTADALRHVYQQIGSTIQTQNRETELTALPALLAAGLVVAGAALSLLWFGRVA